MRYYQGYLNIRADREIDDIIVLLNELFAPNELGFRRSSNGKVQYHLEIREFEISISFDRQNIYTEGEHGMGCYLLYMDGAWEPEKEENEFFSNMRDAAISRSGWVYDLSPYLYFSVPLLTGLICEEVV